jgi:hypothetical protein
MGTKDFLGDLFRITSMTIEIMSISKYVPDLQRCEQAVIECCHIEQAPMRCEVGYLGSGVHIVPDCLLSMDYHDRMAGLPPPH